MNKYQPVLWRWQFKLDLNVEKLTYKTKIWNPLDQLSAQITFNIIEAILDSCNDEFLIAYYKLRRRSND